jgi:hypothetical protein
MLFQCFQAQAEHHYPYSLRRGVRLPSIGPHPLLAWRISGKPDMLVRGNGAPKDAGIPNLRPARRQACALSRKQGPSPAAAFRRAIGGVLLPTAGRASPPEPCGPDCSAGSRQEALVPPGGAPPSPGTVRARHGRRRRIPLRLKNASGDAPRRAGLFPYKGH